MIKYNSGGSFGFGLLFRLHGSAVFKSFLPALLSSLVFILLYEVLDINSEENDIASHPYPFGALISALTFLLAFRANFSYNRYWEAVTSIHQMHSKWLDVGMDLAAFHLQSARYNDRRPPAFGEHPELTDLNRFRERENETTLEELEEQLNNNMEPTNQSLRTRLRKSFFRRRRRRNRQQEEGNKDLPTLSQQPLANNNNNSNTSANPIMAMQNPKRKRYKSISRTSPPTSTGTFTSVFAAVFTSMSKKTATPKAPDSATSLVVRTASSRHFDQAWDHGQPPLFLQEAAHLLSLLSAVAMSTLRNDLEQADSPLTTFLPGVPWPHVDPDAYGADVRKDWTNTHRSVTVIKYLLGMTRSPEDRTLYNAARPFRVIGGVSDLEVELLAAARGPSAKVALVFMWLEEFVSREHLNGSTGKVAPPIISRLFQFLSDGMIGYNQARKVAYIPFPFPHSQITSLFVLVVVGLMPVLTLSFVENESFGFILNFLSVMVFAGLHEVARELESPFFNVPNDLPLNNFQAQFNEALLAMFAGYHPDAYWEVYEATEEEANAANAGGNTEENAPGTIQEGEEEEEVGNDKERVGDTLVEGQQEGKEKSEATSVTKEEEKES